MPKSYEEISKSIANQNGKTDANLANDSNHLGGIAADEYATKEWVKDYHGNKESSLLDYINQQDNAMLNAAKEYTNSAIRNQDFSDFAEIDDLQALNTNLTNKINTDIAGQKSYTDQKTQAIVDDVNANFSDVEDAIDQLNDNVSDLFQSVSDGKELIAEAITDKGVTTSATASFSTMADNINSINTNQGMIVIPDGYMNTSDATATADKILQGYTAYANGNKIHGTYVPSGSGSTGGVILGEDEVVAEKVYGESDILIGRKILPENSQIVINAYGVSKKIALVCTNTKGSYVVADRKLTENVDNEIVIYNITNKTTTSNEYETVISHSDYNEKYSYTYSELGIEGTVNCIVASPLRHYDEFVQISIGTSTAIYTFWFNPNGNNGNGSIGEANPLYPNKTKITINSSCSYNDIAYSNTKEDTFAYFSNEKIYIVGMNWWSSASDYTEYTNVDALTENVLAQFRFSANDRFLTYIQWGTTQKSEVCIMLLNEHVYLTQEEISETGSVGWNHGQILINSAEDFMIFNGKPYMLTYNLAEKTISYISLSGTEIIPFDNTKNETAYATFSKNDKYVYAVLGTGTGTMYKLANYKVDYISLNSQWDKASSDYQITSNSNIPVIDTVNNKILCFCPDDQTEGFYYYDSDPNVKEVIGLEYNNVIYKRT